MRTLRLAGLLALLAPAAAGQGFVAGNLFVSDASGVVLEFTPNGGLVRTLSSPADFGASPARGLAFGPGGTLAVAAVATDKVVVFDATGAKVGETAGGGLDEAYGLAFGPNGETWVASGATSDVIVFDAAGTVLRSASGGGLGAPRALAFGPNGHLFAVDEGDDGAYEFDPAGESIDLRGTGAASAPYGAAFGPDGSLYVTTTAPAGIAIVDASGVASTITDASLPAPRGLGFSFDGRLYVANETPPGVVRFHFTPGNTIVQTISDPAMAGPLFLAFAPARFRLSVSAKSHSSGGVSKVKDAYDAATGAGPVLSLFPVGALLALGDDPADSTDLASLLGAAAVAWTGTSVHGAGLRSFAGSQVSVFGDLLGSVHLTSTTPLDSVRGTLSFQVGGSILAGKLKGKPLP